MQSGHVAQAGETAGGVRVRLDLLFLLYQDKRKITGAHYIADFIYGKTKRKRD